MQRRRRNALFSFTPAFVRPHQRVRRGSSAPKKKQHRARKPAMSADTADLVSALRNLGYRRDVAQASVRAARGSSFDDRLRDAMAIASGRRVNPMKKKSRKRKIRTVRRKSHARRRARNTAQRPTRLTTLAKVKRNPRQAPKHAVVKGHNPIALQSTKSEANKLASWLRRSFPGSKIRVVRAERFLKK